jgi:hypothetical protein
MHPLPRCSGAPIEDMSTEPEQPHPPQALHNLDASVRIGKGAKLDRSAVGMGARVTLPPSRTISFGTFIFAITTGVVSNMIFGWWPHFLRIFLHGGK